ncbi:hypothetical protein PAL_GLEAN10008076 [Pteropus alecto]|uniref:Uncharacterized protein n=1 Tax=Pteropus alecto TaxID=9402 RepID=L5K042_PTEAL|nr:hypothetical protein PAL_GLEAN10008076 [Pteropus alecto]
MVSIHGAFGTGRWPDPRPTLPGSRDDSARKNRLGPNAPERDAAARTVRHGLGPATAGGTHHSPGARAPSALTQRRDRGLRPARAATEAENWLAGRMHLRLLGCT